MCLLLYIMSMSRLMLFGLKPVKATAYRKELPLEQNQEGELHGRKLTHIVVRNLANSPILRTAAEIGLKVDLLWKITLRCVEPAVAASRLARQAKLLSRFR